ncbi:MAG TPA: hypothetical protein VMB71_15690, partial [Acetobacteraceae bacterium]|nr:hypothetical protein [Acetobacteraceae bacterium]
MFNPCFLVQLARSSAKQRIRRNADGILHLVRMVHDARTNHRLAGRGAYAARHWQVPAFQRGHRLHDEIHPVPLLTLEDAERIAPALCEAGIDAIDISCGSMTSIGKRTRRSKSQP